MLEDEATLLQIWRNDDSKSYLAWEVFCKADKRKDASNTSRLMVFAKFCTSVLYYIYFSLWATKEL